MGFFKSIFKSLVGDESLTIRSVSPTTRPISQTPAVKPNILTYTQSFSGNRGALVSSPYDLSDIGKAEDTDCFVRQAFEKKEGLMFKEGVTFKGTNKSTVRYVKTRFAQIAQATGIPFPILLKRVARSLIRTSNAFIVKKRDVKASGGRVRQTPDGKELKPIAGYFTVAPETMKAEIDKETGRIKRWEQCLPDGKKRYFKVEDVVHFAIHKREGFLFGVPTVVPVLDDVRALRQIEENIELLIYQHIFPLFHYKVGTESAPAGYTEEGVKEIDAVKSAVRLMPSEGAIITPERHEITAIGVEGRALRAESYLTHFKKRVFAGLGVSQVDMGDGDTTNRATANTLSRALIDSVKSVQDDLEVQWDHKIINELLLESTFGVDVLEEDNAVHIVFSEIDIQNKMEQEKHAAELFVKNGLTWDEFRGRLGMEPIIVPEDGEDQDSTKYAEWFNTYWKLFEEPLNLIRAVDEPYSIASQAAALARSVGITPEQQQTAQKTKEADQKREADNAAKARAQGNKKTTRDQIQDNMLSEAFINLATDSQNRAIISLNSSGEVDYDYLEKQAYAWVNHMLPKIQLSLMSEFLSGFDSSTSGIVQDYGVVANAREEIRRRQEYLLNRLVKDSISLAKSRIDRNLKDDTLSDAEHEIAREIRIAFESVQYRTKFMWDTERKKARNYGYLAGGKLMGFGQFEYVSHPEGCEACKAIDGRLADISGVNIDNIPPLHPSSRMKLQLTKRKE